LELYQECNRRWEQDIPAAAACPEPSRESCLNFFPLPVENWVSLHAPNIIERRVGPLHGNILGLQSALQ